MAYNEKTTFFMGKSTHHSLAPTCPHSHNHHSEQVLLASVFLACLEMPPSGLPSKHYFLAGRDEIELAANADSSNRVPRLLTDAALGARITKLECVVQIHEMCQTTQCGGGAGWTHTSSANHTCTIWSTSWCR